MAVDFTEKSKRYQAIDEIIASGRKLKWTEIIAELKSKYDIKTSRTSFFRDIEELQEKYNAPIDTDFQTSGYFYTDPQYRLPRFYTDENAAKAAKLIKTLMDTVKGNPLYKEAQEVFESLATESRDLSLENIKINKKPDNDRIIFVGAPNKEVPAETWRIIDKALQENRVITFDYKSLTDEKPHPRRVQPWQLIFDNGNWNLHALDIIKNGRRRYSLSEIKNLQITNEVFTLPKDYDFRKMTIGSFGCMCHDTLYSVSRSIFTRLVSTHTVTNDIEIWQIANRSVRREAVVLVHCTQDTCVRNGKRLHSFAVLSLYLSYAGHSTTHTKFII